MSLLCAALAANLALIAWACWHRRYETDGDGEDLREESIPTFPTTGLDD